MDQQEEARVRALTQEVLDLKKQLAAKAAGGMNDLLAGMMNQSAPALENLTKQIEKMKAMATAMTPKKMDEAVIDGIKCSVSVDHSAHLMITFASQDAAEAHFTNLCKKA